MEIKRIKAALAGLVIIGLTLTACSGDDGDTGPRGPAGVDGTNGQDGVANIDVRTFEVSGDDWVASNGSLNDTISVPEITNEVMTKGTVQVFHAFDPANPTWNPLVYRFVGVIGGNAQFLNVSNSYALGEVYLNVIAETGAQFTFDSATNWAFKVVVIPPAAMVDGVDVTNYEELQAVYGLEEYDVPQFNTKD